MRRERHTRVFHQCSHEGVFMAEIPPELGDKIHSSTLDVLARVSADLTALGAFTSVDEPLPGQQANIRLFHESAQRGCAQLKHYFELWYTLVRGRQWTAPSSGLQSTCTDERETLWLREQAQQLVTQLRALEAIDARDTLREAQRCVDLYKTAYALRNCGLRVEVKGHFLVINGAKQSEICVNSRGSEET